MERNGTALNNNLASHLFNVSIYPEQLRRKYVEKFNRDLKSMISTDTDTVLITYINTVTNIDINQLCQETTFIRTYNEYVYAIYFNIETVVISKALHEFFNIHF